MTTRIIDWPASAEDPLDVPPGGEAERVITPQKFVVLHWILVSDLVLVHLRIGAVDEVPFELEEDGPQRVYKPTRLDDVALKKRLVATGAAVATRDSIAIIPGLEVTVRLRNDGDVPVKPRVALLVREEEVT